MKFTETQIRKIIKEEVRKLSEAAVSSDEKRYADVAHILLSRARAELEDFLGTLGDSEEPSEELQSLYDSIAKSWELSDRILSGGEDPKGLEWLRNSGEETISENAEVNEARSTRDITADSLDMAVDIKKIINELLPNMIELSDREKFASADMDGDKPIKVRPGTTEVPRLQEIEEDE